MDHGWYDCVHVAGRGYVNGYRIFVSPCNQYFFFFWKYAKNVKKCLSWFKVKETKKLIFFCSYSVCFFVYLKVGARNMKSFHCGDWCSGCIRYNGCKLRWWVLGYILMTKTTFCLSVVLIYLPDYQMIYILGIDNEQIN